MEFLTYKTLYAKRETNGKITVVDHINDYRWQTPIDAQPKDILRAYWMDDKLFVLVVPDDHTWAELSYCEVGEWGGVRLELTWQTFANSPKFPKDPRKIPHPQIAQWLAERL